MNPVLKEYKGFIAAVSVALIGVGGCVAFSWFAYQNREKAMQSFKSKSDEINRYRSAVPPPTKAHSEQLQKQFDEVEKTVQTLRSAVVANDIFSLQPISPQDFQKALNEKAQALFKKARKDDKSGKDSVTLPVTEGESSAESFFYLSFKEFKTKPPSPEQAPVLNRQLLLTELILNLLLDNNPLSIRKVKLMDHEPPPPTPPPSKPSGNKKDVKAEPQAPSLNAQTFEVHFSARPESLREYLNALSTEKQAFFVVRNLKVVNSKEKEPPRKGENPSLPNIGSQGQPNLAPSVDASTKYILGDEFVDVELTVESLTLPPVADTSKKDAQKR